MTGKGVCTEGDEGVIARFPLIQGISAESSLADLVGAIPSKMRQQFQYLLTQPNPKFLIAAAPCPWETVAFKYPPTETL